MAVEELAGDLRARTKLAYAGGELGAAGLYVAVNTWLLYYLVNIVQLRPLQAGAAFIVGRTFDALIDPLVGDLVDRRRGRTPLLWWVRRGILPLAAAFVALWWLPSLGGPAFLVATLSFVLFSTAYTFVSMPYLALTPALAPTYDGRTSLTAYRMAVATVASLLAVALPPLLVAVTTGVDELAATPASGWLVMGGVFAALGTAGCLVVLTGVREPPAGVRPPAEPFAWDRLVSVFRVAAFRTVFASFVLITVGMMLTNSLLPFFLESVLGLTASEQTPVLGGLFGIAIASVPLWNLAAGRLGKGRALAVGTVVHTVGLLALVGLRPGPDQPLLLWGLLVVAGAGLAALIVLPWAMIPDVVEFDELAVGRRREGLVYALCTLGQKTASSVGVFASAIVATVFGYDAGRAVQTEDTVRGLAFGLGPGAAVVYAVALVLVLRTPSRAAHDAVVAALRARTAAVSPPAAPPSATP